MVYYFAYGSNMNHKQMEKRCGKGNFKFIGKALLKDYRFVYDGYSNSRNGAVANIVYSVGNQVWGGLYEISESCLEKLDKYEGYPYFYEREKMVVTTDDKKIEAYVYFRKPKNEGSPSQDYINVVLEGAKNCGLPDDYTNRFILRK